MNSGILVAILVTIIFLVIGALYLFRITNKRVKRAIRPKSTVEISHEPPIVKNTDVVYWDKEPVKPRPETSQVVVRTLTSSSVNTCDSDLMDNIQTGIVMGVTAAITEKIVSDVIENYTESSSDYDPD